MGKSKWFWTVLASLFVLLYFTTRLYNLTGLPIFTDEAIYIRWSQIGANDANWRFISLTDGKQPLFTWVMMGLLKVVNGDPLFVGRLTSVIAGFFTLLGIWIVTFELFRNKTAAWISSLVYILLPFSLWYDRLALYDSWVAALSVWSLYLAVRLARHPELDISMLLGMSLGAGMLNKSSAFLGLYFLPATLLLFDWKVKQVGKRLGTWLFYAAFAAIFSQVIYSILRLSPFFHMVGQKDNVFVFTLGEWLHQPFRFLIGNLKGMFDWLTHYMTIPLFLVTLLPLFYRDNKLRERIFLYVWWLLPFLALANFAKILYPRFILFMAMPLVILSGVAFTWAWQRIERPLLRILLITIVFIPIIWTSWGIVVSPKTANIPISDKSQFVDDWPAGGGVQEVVAFLKQESTKGSITVFTEGTFGLLPYALEIYLVNNPNVKITGLWPLPHDFPIDIESASYKNPTFLILNETQVAPPGWPLTLIGEYQKGVRVDRKLRMYKVVTPLAAL